MPRVLHLPKLISPGCLSEHDRLEASTLLVGRIGEMHHDFVPEAAVDFFQRETLCLGQPEPDDDDVHERQDYEDQIVLPLDVGESGRSSFDIDECR